MIEQKENIYTANGSDDTLFNFPHISYTQIGEYPDGLKDIQNRKIDGFLVRGVLTPQEADSIVQEFKKIDNSRFEHNPSGRNIPKPFATVTTINEPGVPLDEYFIRASDFWEKFPEKFGVDFKARVKEVFEKLGGGRPVDVPRESNLGVTFSPAQMREMYTGKGGIYVHCGKFFRDRFSKFYTYLNDVSLVEEQISYFIMLRPPAEGGELTVYDISYDNVKQKETEWDNKKLIADDGSLIDLEDPANTRRRKLRPGKGDMIIFDGGNIWHRVEDPKGDLSRITAGGFVTFSHDNEKIYFWG
jgi:hapalindole-type alkaloid chlorinase